MRAVLEQVAGHPNVPRKKAKFGNFLKNSLRIYDGRLIEEAWSVIEKQDTSKATATDGKPAANQNGSNGHAVENGSRKRKVDDEAETNGHEKSARLADESVANDGETDSQDTDGKCRKFKWSKILRSVLQETDGMAVKKLKKRVRKQYKESIPDEFDPESFKEKFKAHLEALVSSAKVQLYEDGRSARLCTSATEAVH